MNFYLNKEIEDFQILSFNKEQADNEKIFK